MRSAEALSVDSSTQTATMDALAAPLARVLALPEKAFAQWWCGGAASRYAHQDDYAAQTAAAAAAAETATQARDGAPGGAEKMVVAGVTYRADLGCRVPLDLRPELAKAGTLRVAERALLLHHLLGNLHIHDARAEEGAPRGKFLGLLLDALAGDHLRRRAAKNLAAHTRQGRPPRGTVASHDVVIVQTLLDEGRAVTRRRRGGGGGGGQRGGGRRRPRQGEDARRGRRAPRANGRVESDLGAGGRTGDARGTIQNTFESKAAE